mmetsp:Transcript_13441/g.25331  ORF Transcript_13441/g.25331 Transcript_13441/m.25331 type:complete len:103 (-) Transcript_13441:3127-3435(-)
MGCVGNREKPKESPASPTSFGDEPPSALSTSSYNRRRSSEPVKRDYNVVASRNKEETFNSLMDNWAKLDSRVEKMCIFEDEKEHRTTGEEESDEDELTTKGE